MEDLDEAVRRYESSALPERVKAALRLADAFLADPAGLDEGRTRAIREQLRPEQIVELAYKLVFFGGNKPTIATGFDAAVDEEQLTGFDYDREGYFVLDGLGDVNRTTG